MTMPKASVNEDNCPRSFHHEIRRSWKFGDVDFEGKTERLEEAAKGQLRVSINGGYTMPSGGSAGTVAVIVDFSDDRGNAITGTMTITIQ